MKQSNIILWLAVFMSMTSTNLFAHDIAVENEDGVTIYYNYINDGKELEVTHMTYSVVGHPATYSGSVKIPETAKSNGRERKVTAIGAEAFYNCSNLTSVTIPNSVTTIGRYAFSNCSGLKSVKIYDLEAWCKISFASESANPLCYAHHLFLNDVEIKDLVIPNSVTTIGGLAFYKCSGLKSVTIPNSVTIIGSYAFSGCSGLTSVTIPNSVTTIGGSAFYKCSGLTSVTIPNSVTTIGAGAFEECSGLTSVTIPNSVTTIGSSAFSNCSGLKSVKIYDLEAWCKISFASESANPLCYAHHLFLNDVEIKDLVIPNSVTTIGGLAFYDCSGLTSVTIPNSVTTIGRSAFYYCSGLTSVTIPNSVTTIGADAFYKCSGLKSVTIPNSVTTIGADAFRGCYGLTSVTIGVNVKTIEWRAFNFTNRNGDLVEIYSHMKNPPTITTDVFSDALYNDASLYIPAGTLGKYKQTEYWNKFIWVEEIDYSTGIDSVVKQEDTDKRSYYTIDGTHIPAPQKGVNIVKTGDGKTKKVVVK